MDYDAYGRPLQGRGNDQSAGYFQSDATPEYSRHYPSEQQRDRDNLNSPRWNHAHQRYSPPILNDRMPAAPARSEPVDKISEANVSPEFLAAITEKIKREVMEHFKQTGGVEDSTRAPPPMQRQRSKESSSTSSPPPSTRRVYTPPSPAQPPLRTSYPPPPPPPPPPMQSARSPPGSPLDKPSNARFSDARGPPRPLPTGRSYSTAELSAVDHKWGKLFDQGRPTQRLGQFLRGLANHIIEDFTPKKSIVVTPTKMAEYYAKHGLEKEPHPLLSIFRSQSNENISQLYQDLGCQHHLIQEQASMPCTIPALTPLGFAHWMTIQILSYPEEEWKRLERVVLAMPVNADGEMIDGKPERLPKQISRYLLPDVEDRKSRKLLDGAIKDFLEDLGSTPRRKNSIASPPLQRQPSTSTSQSSRHTQSHRTPVEIHQEKKSPTTAKPIERERAPYSGAPGSDVSSNNDEGPKIERDRQPYVSQPGNGRVYENLNSSHSRPARANSTSRTRESEIPEIRHSRNNSDARRDSYIPPRSSNRRGSSPPLKSFSNSTPIDISSSYGPNPTSSSTNFTPSQNTFSPRSYGSGNAAFPPPPPAGDRREQYSGRRIPEEDPTSRFANDFQSPREAEQWDRYQESRVAGDPYERGGSSVGGDPRDNIPLRGAPSEEWYRDNTPRPSGYDDFSTRRY